MVKDIHFQEQYLEIFKTLHRVKDHTDNSEHNTKIIITPPKTESSIRNIPIPDFLFEILQQYVQSHKIDPEAYILTGKKMSFREPRSIEVFFQKNFKKMSDRTTSFSLSATYFCNPLRRTWIRYENIK